MTLTKEILVLDHTLRDGEQQTFINFSYEQKQFLGNLIKKTGVQYIDLLPATAEVEREITRSFVKQGFNPMVGTMLKKEAVDLALDCSAKNILLFQAVSDRLLKVRFNSDNLEKIKKDLIEEVIDISKYARSKGLNVFFAGEDMGRANQDFVLELAKKVSPFVDCFIIADSVGYMIPEKMEEIVKILKKEISCNLGVHCHNDMGNADENTIAAVLAGADLISGTFTGIGERAGNACLDNVLFTLKKRHDILIKGINYELINNVCKNVKEIAKHGRVKPFSREAFFHESGIHVNALMKDKFSYSCLDPSLLGLKHEVFFSKKSGISNFIWYFGDRFSKEEYIQMRDKIKEISIKENKTFTLKEIKEILSI